MKSFTYIIKEKLGIHARPAGYLMKEAKQYSSKITLYTNGKSADVKKLIALMALAVGQGAEVTVNIEGEDEEIAAAKLEEFFKTTL